VVVTVVFSNSLVALFSTELSVISLLTIESASILTFSVLFIVEVISLSKVPSTISGSFDSLISISTLSTKK
jgi:hypothetical protein